MSSIAGGPTRRSCRADTAARPRRCRSAARAFAEFADRRFSAALTAIALAALALRLAWGALRGSERFFVEGYTLFFTLAGQLAGGYGYAFPGERPTAFRVPLYPLFLAGLTGGEPNYAPVLIAQALVSTGTVVLAGLLAREWFGARAGLIAAAICAVYPYYVLHDVTLQETGMFIFLSTLATWLALVARRRGSVALAALAGLALGAAILTRATLAPFAVLAILWLALPGAGWRTSRRGMAAFHLCRDEGVRACFF